MLPLCSRPTRHFELQVLEWGRLPLTGFLSLALLVLVPLVSAALAAEPAKSGQATPATTVAFSPTGGAIVTGNKDGYLTFWDPLTGRVSREYKTELTGITFMASSVGAQSIALGASDGTIEIWEWDEDRGKSRTALRGHGAAVTALAFSEDGELLASGSEDRTIKLWQTRSGKLLKGTREGRGSIRTLAFSPDGQLLASDGDEQNIRLWKMPSGDLQGVLKGHEAPVLSVAFSADGEYLASCSGENLLIWNMKRRQSPWIGVETGAHALVFSPRRQDSFLATATDNEIWFWNIDQERRAGALKGHPGKVKSLAFSKDGKQIVSLGCDNTVRLWSVRPNEALLVINTLTAEVSSPSSSSVAGGDSPGKVEVARPLSGKDQEAGIKTGASTAPQDTGGTRSLSEAHTPPAPPSQLKVSHVGLSELDKSARAQSRDRVEVSVSVSNPGPGTVRKARAKLNFGPGVSISAGSPEEFDLGEMSPDAVKILKFSCALSTAIKSGSPIPISVIFTTEFDEFAKEVPLNLVMNAPGTQPQSAESTKPAKTAPAPEKLVISDEQRKELAKGYYEKGNLSFETGDYDVAAASYSKAIELEDGFAPLYYNLAMSQKALHQNDAAARNFKRYLLLRPDAPNAQEVLKMIEGLSD